MWTVGKYGWCRDEKPAGTRGHDFRTGFRVCFFLAKKKKKANDLTVVAICTVWLHKQLLNLINKPGTEVASQQVQGDTKKREILKNLTKIEDIQEKKLLTEIEPLQLAF